jgi:hypothetical protein
MHKSKKTTSFFIYYFAIKVLKNRRGFFNIEKEVSECGGAFRAAAGRNAYETEQGT